MAVRHVPRCVYCGAALPAQPMAPQAPADPMLDRVRSCFALLARCRTAGDLGPAMPWLGQAIAEQLQDEIDSNRRSEVRHVIEHVTVGDVTMALDVGAMRIDAVYAEYWQDVRSHMIVRGLRGAKPHRETWRLAPGRGGDEAVRDRCSGCGADLGARIDVKCPYCGLVPSINRLGFMVTGIEREDPAAIYEEWKHKLASFENRSGLDDFLEALRTVLRD